MGRVLPAGGAGVLSARVRRPQKQRQTSAPREAPSPLLAGLRVNRPRPDWVSAPSIRLDLRLSNSCPSSDWSWARPRPPDLLGAAPMPWLLRAAREAALLRGCFRANLLF